MIEIDYDLKDIVICALRYSLGRKSYVTKSTADFIKRYPMLIDARVKKVMLSDLDNYFEERLMWDFKDDDCDYNTWLDLKEWLEEIK